VTKKTLASRPPTTYFEHVPLEVIKKLVEREGARNNKAGANKRAVQQVPQQRGAGAAKKRR
jgi:hypothetical protein